MSYIWLHERTVMVPLLTCWAEKVEPSETRVSAKSRYLTKNRKINVSFSVCVCVCVPLTWTPWGCWGGRNKETHKCVDGFLKFQDMFCFFLIQSVYVCVYSSLLWTSSFILFLILQYLCPPVVDVAAVIASFCVSQPASNHQPALTLNAIKSKQDQHRPNVLHAVSFIFRVKYGVCSKKKKKLFYWFDSWQPLLYFKFITSMTQLFLFQHDFLARPEATRRPLITHLKFSIKQFFIPSAH